jgi:hypothetical protein
MGALRQGFGGASLARSGRDTNLCDNFAPIFCTKKGPSFSMTWLLCESLETAMSAI